jgi:RNA polymerase sigma factor (sigma-70 family)
VQEALTRAVQNGIALDAEPWLKTVARRVAIDRVRRRREYASGLPVELEKWASDHDGNPEDMVVRAERSAEVRRALEQMPKRYRDVLLTYAEEESPARVARRLGLTPKATWTLLSRARTRLRVDLERLGFVPAFIFGRNRWKALLGSTAAAAGIVATIALLPNSIEPGPPKTPLVQAPHTAPSVAAVTEPVAGLATSPPVQGIVETVEEVVDFVPRKIGTVGVRSCVRDSEGEKADLFGGGFSFVQDGPDPGLFGNLVTTLPEPLRKLELDLC